MPEVTVTVVFKGDVLEWNGIEIVVMRVARGGSWADIRCTGPGGATWTKRQSLPMPAGTIRVGRAS